jgi:uridine phosphorylase
MPFLVTPEQTLRAARLAGVRPEDLDLAGIAVVTFSKCVVDRLHELATLRDTMWISAHHHPYAAARVVRRGEYRGVGVTVIVPPMGASPLACILEDLVASGAQVVFLVCAAWSLGPPVEFGDLIVPAVSVGFDGTSIHYGNQSGRVQVQPEVLEALVGAGQTQDAQVRVGGNSTCEALYRITPGMVNAFRRQGCICMDNGEASTLFAAARTLGVPGGVLFQPYIDLARGWDPSQMDGARYSNACLIQADVALDAGAALLRTPR